MKPSLLRKRTDNIEGYMENWHDHYETAKGLEDAGRLLQQALWHMRELEAKMNDRAILIRELQEKLKRKEQ